MSATDSYQPTDEPIPSAPAKRSKRPHNSGSVYQLSSTGRWQVQLRMADGTWVRRNAKSRSEALRKLNALHRAKAEQEAALLPPEIVVESEPEPSNGIVLHRPFITLEDLVALLPLSKSSIYKMVRAGRIRTVRLGSKHVVPTAEWERICTEGIK